MNERTLQATNVRSQAMTRRTHVRRLAAFLLLGLAARMLFAMPPAHATARDYDRTRPGDTSRFLWQGLWLVEGRGYLSPNGSEPCTSLPPGYPAFLAVLLLISESTWFVVAVQLVLSLASIALVYATFTRLPGSPTFWPTLLMAVWPWLAATPTQLMSEHLGVFLTALVAWLVVRFEQDKWSVWSALLCGFLTMYACLVVPAVTFSMAGIWCVLFVRSRRQVLQAAALACGALIVFVPWQAHVHRATGRFAPQLLTPIERSYHGTLAWMRTWVLTPDDFQTGMGVFIAPNPEPDYATVPDRAYPDAATRARAEQLAAAWRTAGEGRRANDTEDLYRPVDAFFAALATQRKSDVVHSEVIPIAARAWMLWWSMPDVKMFMSRHVARLWPTNIAEQFQFGTRRGVLRLGLAVVSGLLLLAYCGVQTWFVWLCVQAWRHWQWIPAVIASGVVIYIALSAGLATIESRRNLPFIPLLLLVWWYALRRRAAGTGAGAAGT